MSACALGEAESNFDLYSSDGCIRRCSRKGMKSQPEAHFLRPNVSSLKEKDKHIRRSIQTQPNAERTLQQYNYSLLFDFAACAGQTGADAPRPTFVDARQIMNLFLSRFFCGDSSAMREIRGKRNASDKVARLLLRPSAVVSPPRCHSEETRALVSVLCIANLEAKKPQAHGRSECIHGNGFSAPAHSSLAHVATDDKTKEAFSNRPPK